MPADSRLQNGVASLAYVAGIRVLIAFTTSKAWMAGTSPAMTNAWLCTNARTRHARN